MIKKTHFMIIALIALTLIVMPGSAWVSEYTFTTSPNNGGGWVQIYNSWLVHDMDTLDDEITRVYQEGVFLYQGENCALYDTGSTTGSIDCYSESTGTWETCGNATISWDIGDACVASFQNGHIDMTINDISTTKTGEGQIRATTATAMFPYIGLNRNFYYSNHADYKGGASWTSDYDVCLNTNQGNCGFDVDYTIYSGSSVVTPEASFTCTPTSQYPDTDVVCTDTSTNTPTDWYWTIDAEAIGYDGWQTHTGQNFTWQSHYPGFYSVNLRANNSAGSDWENKTNYVSISVNATPNNCDIEPLTGYIRTYAQTNDGMTSGGIYNSDIQMRDMEGGAWSNVTNSGGWWCIDTLPGHSLNLYAQATGYTSVESIGVSANGGRHYLVMWPDYIPAPSAGNVTLYALIYDQQTGSPLYLSSVRVDGNTINTILKNTGPEGQAMFTIKNDTSIHVTASKSGYSTITKVMTTSHLGPDTIMISLPRASTTATATATPTPSWMTPVTTIDPRTPSQKDADMMDLIRNNGSALIGLAIITTMLGLMKMWGK